MRWVVKQDRESKESMLTFVGLNADDANILMMFTMLTILVWYVRIHCLGTMNVCMTLPSLEPCRWCG